MPLITYKKKDKKYKYNDYDQVNKWSVEKVNKNIADINPDIICKLALDENKDFIHPDLDFNKDELLCYNEKCFTVYKKNKKYKYNNYNEIKNWSIEERNKHIKEDIDDIDQEILCAILTEGNEKFIHPDLDCVNRIKREKQKIK